MLPDFGWTELLLIAIVLIVVVGPKDLPRVVRGFSKSLGSIRKMAGDFRKQFDDALSEAEMDDLKTLASDVQSLDPRNSIKDALSPLGKVGEDINDELKGIANSVEKADVSDAKVTPQQKTNGPLDKTTTKKENSTKRAADSNSQSSKIKKKTTSSPRKKNTSKKSASTPNRSKVDKT